MVRSTCPTAAGPLCGAALEASREHETGAEVTAVVEETNGVNDQLLLAVTTQSGWPDLIRPQTWDE